MTVPRHDSRPFDGCHRFRVGGATRQGCRDMGCFGSKPAQNQELLESKPRQQPGTQHPSRRQSRAASPSRRRGQPGSSRRGSRRTSRAPSPTGGGRRSSTGSRSGTSAGRRRTTVPQVIPEEGYHQPAEDDQIIFEFETIKAYILNHAANYYRDDEIPSIRRHIGEKIVRAITDRQPGGMDI
jgi:hypothetical protein